MKFSQRSLLFSVAPSHWLEKNNFQTLQEEQNFLLIKGGNCFGSNSVAGEETLLKKVFSDEQAANNANHLYVLAFRSKRKTNPNESLLMIRCDSNLVKSTVRELNARRRVATELWGDGAQVRTSLKRKRNTESTESVEQIHHRGIFGGESRLRLPSVLESQSLRKSQIVSTHSD